MKKAATKMSIKKHLCLSMLKESHNRMSKKLQQGMATYKGFFFTVLALVLLSFIFISLQLWAQAQTQAEARAAERFRAEALQTALKIVDAQTVVKYSNASVVYALQKLATAIEDHPNPLVAGMKYYKGPKVEYPDGTYYLNASIYELMRWGNTSGYLVMYNGMELKDSRGWYFNDTTNPAAQNLTYSQDEMKYSFSSFFNITSEAVRSLGYEVSWGEIEGFALNQTDRWTMRLTMTVPMNFSDREGRISINKRIFVNLSIPIDGLTDPSIARADIRHRPDFQICTNNQLPPINVIGIRNRPHRNIYRVEEYNMPQDASAKLKARGIAGLGWFFGPVTDQDNNSFSYTSPTHNLSRINYYIYKTSDPQAAITQSAYFGGIILIAAPSMERTEYDEVRNGVSCHYTNSTETNCLFCLFHQTSNDSRCPTVEDHIINETIPLNPYIPWVQVENDPTSGIPLNYHLGLPELLISNDINATDLCGSSFNATNLACTASTTPIGLNAKYANIRANTKIWDLTGPRDMAICGFYVASPFGPSYSQRFTYFWGQAQNGKYSTLDQGIESFVVGQWAGGGEDICAKEQGSSIESYSRLDYHFYNFSGLECLGPFIKGMPGCKNYIDCQSRGPLENATGRFAFSNYTSSPSPDPNDPSIRYGLENITIVGTINPVSSGLCR
jgi:hypothetical protein